MKRDQGTVQTRMRSTSCALLSSSVDFIELFRGAVPHGGQRRGERCRRGGLTIVDMSYDTDVNARLLPVKLPARSTHSQGATAEGANGEITPGGGDREGLMRGLG